MLKRIKNWMQFRRNVRELEGLSDKQLRDIGMTRGMILHYAKKATYCDRHV